MLKKKRKKKIKKWKKMVEQKIEWTPLTSITINYEELKKNY